MMDFTDKFTAHTARCCRPLLLADHAHFYFFHAFFFMSLSLINLPIATDAL
jgi:hypothetical protein